MISFKLKPRHIVLAAGLSILGGLAAVAYDAIKQLHLHITPKTMFGPAGVLDVVDDDGRDVRVLAVGRCYQSATYLGANRFVPVFAYYRAFDVMWQMPEPPQRICMIGGGAYSYTKHVLSAHPEASIDTVEIDPAITELAKRYFFLDEALERYGETAKTTEVHSPEGLHATIEDHGRARLICADGRDWIEHSASVAYDVVVNDAFSGSEMPESLRGTDFARLVRRTLSPSGLYLVNVVANGKPLKLAPVHQAANELADVFGHVWVIQADDDNFQSDENYVLVASDANHHFADAIPYTNDAQVADPNAQQDTPDVQGEEA